LENFYGITGIASNILIKRYYLLITRINKYTKGFINNIINNSLTNRDNFRNATQFGQSAYADAENRPQGQIYGKDIRGR
jgi:hypothetical protein